MSFCALFELSVPFTFYIRYLKRAIGFIIRGSVRNQDYVRNISVSRYGNEHVHGLSELQYKVFPSWMEFLGLSSKTPILSDLYGDKPGMPLSSQVRELAVVTLSPGGVKWVWVHMVSKTRKLC